MPSPFPGMDPYLEGYLWPDVHQALANKIRQQITPRLKPRYVARLAITMIEDTTPQVEIGVMYPDVEVVTTPQADVPVPLTAYGAGSLIAEVTEELVAPLTVPISPIEVRLVTVEVRDVARNELVTSIEILSPINKREPDLIRYRQKRERLHRAGVHLLEIDLLRRGTRPFSHPRIPDVPYRIILTRAHAGRAEVWPIRLQDKLPVVPVPLRAPDRDVRLELSAAVAAIYDEAAYDLSINYTEPPPPPPLSPEEMEWAQSLMKREA